MTTEFYIFLFCLYVADPARLLVSDSVLWKQLVYSVMEIYLPNDMNNTIINNTKIVSVTFAKKRLQNAPLNWDCYVTFSKFVVV